MNYVRCRGHAKAWPATKKLAFWSSAADFIVNCNPEISRRTGTELTYMAIVHVMYMHATDG